MNILVTGGLGYIGSHTCVALLNAGHGVVIVDDTSNSDVSALDRIREAAGLNANGADRLALRTGDVCDTVELCETMLRYKVDAVLHFAAKKAVGESVQQPVRYYENNVGGLLSVIRAMANSGVYRIIFSSSATVYGDEMPPFMETMPTYGCNPYGWSKVMCERVLLDAATAGKGWNGGLSEVSVPPLHVAVLRYFNPLGAHKSGLLGENPVGIPNNLLPFVVQVALGQREKLYVFGNDYPTRDGTCERDYIHVCDVADGHVLALEHLAQGVQVYNLGTGRGQTVLEVIDAFEKSTGVTIPFEFSPRREGDIAICYADVQKAEAELGFTARHNLMDMCRDHYLAAKAMQMR